MSCEHQDAKWWVSQWCEPVLSLWRGGKVADCRDSQRYNWRAIVIRRWIAIEAKHLTTVEDHFRESRLDKGFKEAFKPYQQTTEDIAESLLEV